MTYPIVLPHDQIARIVDRHASLLILTRSLRPGAYEIQDSLIVRQNTAHKKEGRIDLTRDPAAFIIEITRMDKRRLVDLDLLTVRRTGHKTFEEFFDDWLYRRRRIDVSLEVRLYTFRLGEDARFLHAKSHRGYTSSPVEGLRGEGQALSREDQARVSHAAFERDDDLRRARVKAEHARVVEAVGLLRAATQGHRGMGRKIRAVEHQLSSLERDL